jgi:chaperonin cofactor prefoldin
LFYAKVDDTDSMIHVSEQEVEIEVPDNYDPRAQQIAALEKQKQKVMADYQKMVTDINERISKLQALEYTA